MGVGAMGPAMMGGWRPGWGWTGGVGVIFMVLFWALLIGGVAVLVRWVADAGTAGQCSPPGGESATAILKRRYARGEIGRAEFEQAMNDLR